jgi:subtilase family serine protease
VNTPFKLFVSAAAALAVAACSAGGNSSLPGTGGLAPTAQTRYVPQWEAQHLAKRACNDVREGYMNCDVLIENRSSGANPDAYSGWTPPSLQQAYNLPVTQGSKKTIVAIVDAFDNPNVASDLATFRSAFKLGTANFKKFNQQGQQKDYPAPNSDWGVEIDLDVQMVSTSCPKCSVYLVEATSNNGNDLYTAEKTAAKLGATVISNSWGGGQGSASGGSFDQKGILYLASAGDGGYGAQDPADYDNVVAVGGTVLQQASKGFNEIIWPDSGGGCSIVAKPSWQKDPKCKSGRTMNDISAVAQQVEIYDSYPTGGWGTVAGTSISSPLVGGMYGLAGNGSKLTAGENLWKLTKKQLKKDLHYIKTGNLGGCPQSVQGTYLCNAGTKQFGNYSAGSGWGTPNGLGAL